MSDGAVRDPGMSEAARRRVGPKSKAMADAVRDYVLRRQNPDGGYTFAQGSDSNAQDTYYGLAILRLLNVEPPRISATVNWLRSFPADNLYGYYYVFHGLRLCGEPPQPGLAKRILALRRPDGSFGTMEVGVAAPSEFHSAFMAIEILSMLGFTTGAGATARWLLRHRNRDGGFGAHGRSNLRSTFHAVASLQRLAYDVRKLRTTVPYVRSCELASGGFSVVPDSSISYMEDIFCGVLTLDILGERCRYPDKTAERVRMCFNSNGGFRRSTELGISTFEDTYYALTILGKVENHG